MSTSHSSATTRPPVDFDQEVRFAVVMYGGASLAIYINGVAQELLRLVRATAPEIDGPSNGRQAHLADEELRGSERVYRRLGRLLRRQGVPTARLDATNSDAGARGPIRTRFVVDILTGTSAGGINAVYLAKALANNQNIDKLKNLWVTEGDIGALINDKDSYDGLDFDLTDLEGEPWSLLNSRRMHWALLDALRGMDADKRACPKGTSPLVDELDLYVTATDMFGRPIQMRLADDVVSERRHRNVFQFRYRSKRASDVDQSDFEPRYNPFLAFVARATSAHQAAFCPIRLKDVALVTGKDPKGPALEEHPGDDKELRAFYRDYLLKRATNGSGEAAEAHPEVLTEALADAFQGVWFVDGGTLDNKPFSFVTEELPLRRADTFVDRKLLYIEPSPEQADLKKAPDDRPRIVGNAVAGLSSLPRYETIVEDLTRLLERNRLIERLDNIMRGMEKDLIYGMPQKPRRTRKELLDEILTDREKFLDWLKAKGTSWGSYQRLRVAEVTDDLTLLVARAAGFSEESDEFLAIRYLVRHWRDSNYDPHMERGKRSQVQFLIEFDLLWAMRRIRFVLKKLNQLACLSENDEDARRTAGVAHGQSKSDVWLEESDVEFREAVQNLRRKLNEAYVELRGERRRLWLRAPANPFSDDIKALKITSGDLLALLREPTDRDRRNQAEALLMKPFEHAPDDAHLKTRSDAINALTDRVKEELETVIDNARRNCSKALRPPEGAAADRLPRWERFLRETLWYYYVYFDDFDQVAYPLLYSTGVGEEADVIDVFRVSPRDATALIDEREKFDDKGKKVKELEPKLAGTTLSNFGAFFERKFRINDIMWGRLDGAERIIAALLPSDPDLKTKLTREAHREIIEEEATNRLDLARAQAEKVFGNMEEHAQRARSNVALRKQVEEALDRMASKKDCEAQLDRIEKGASSMPVDSLWRVFLESFVVEFRPFMREYIVPCAQGKDPIDAFKNWFKAQYDEGRTFTEYATLSSALRINRVLGDMALPYFAPEGPTTWKGRQAMRIGKRLLLFTEAAIDREGDARRKQRFRLAVSYVVSFLIAAFVSLPAILLLRSATGPWSILGFTIILIVTLPLALIPLVLTGGYNFVWLKLRGELEKRLLNARKRKTQQ